MNGKSGKSIQSQKAEYFSGMGSDWDEIAGNDQERIRALEEVFTMIAPERNALVIDVGCGSGVLIPIIESYIGDGGRIIAVDSAPGMIEEARKKHARFENVDFRVGLIEEAELSGTGADMIICFAVFPHIDDKKAALERFREALKPGGTLYIFHVIDTRSLNEFHSGLDAPVSGDRMPEREELERLLGEGSFRIERYIDREGLNFVKAVAER
jgi:demethylmenaquinone methyltransferase/2-methoxy-6-polyprenyl-1,4-benzoquinol methylase